MPYGFTKDADDTLIPIEVEANLIKEIFHLYTRRRLGCRAIATSLNRRGLLRRGAPRKGTKQLRMVPWSHKTVADVLTNRVYLGEVLFREIIAVDAHEAIIDPVTFELAQEILVQRGEAPNKAASPSGYHLTGKITCPTCSRRYVGTNAHGRNRTYRYYTCWTRSRYGVDQCHAPRLDADALDTQVLAALRDFYTNRLGEAREAIAAAQAEQRQARASHKQELNTIERRLTAKEAVIDRYLIEYEDNKIDRDTVAERVEKISEEIRQLRHRRDELTFMLDVDGRAPDATHLHEIRDRITEIIDEGATPERKAVCEALIAELRIDGQPQPR